MELDDFKSKPRLESNNSEEAVKNKEERINNLIDLFISYKKEQKKKLISVILINFFFAVVYIVYMLSQKDLAELGYLILGIGFFSTVLYLSLRYKSFSAKTYSLSMKEFLDLAVRRTSYFTNVDYIIVVPLLMLIGTGGGLVFTVRLLRYTDNSTLLILIWVLFFISLCLFGFWAGKRNWQKETGDLNRRLMEMKKNYTSDDN